MKQRKGETVEEYKARRKEYEKARYEAKLAENGKARTYETGIPTDKKEERYAEKRNAKKRGDRTKVFSCDFETEAYTQEEIDRYREEFNQYPETWVWLWGAVRVREKGTHTDKDKFHGNNIESFFEWLFSIPNGKFFFHNLKFDGNFILSYLETHGYKFYDKIEGSCGFEPPTPFDGNNLQYSTLIADTGQWYSLTIYKWYNAKWHSWTIQDSLKLLNFSVAKIAKDFNCTKPKGECDYTKHRPKGYEPTDDEVDYCLTDCQIIAEALFGCLGLGADKMTIASSAKARCKDILDAIAKLDKDAKTFEDYFPQLDTGEDAFVRHSYRGGFTFCNPYFQGIDLHENGFVLDVNSMYPAVMLYKPLPYGIGTKYEGSYEDASKRDELVAKKTFYFQRFRASFRLKKGGIPFIQSKAGMFNQDATYTAHEEEFETTLSKPDFELFFENYDVWDYEPIDGFCYYEKVGLLAPYIDKYAEMKRTAPKGSAERALAKLFLNSIYGKFGSSPEKNQKIPYLDENGVIKYKVKKVDPDAKNTLYVPYASAVTAQSRTILFGAIKAYGMRRFAYCDTDSVHIIGEYDEAFCAEHGVEIHSSKFGAWKCESTFDRAKYLHTKCYAENIITEDFEPVEPHIEARVAGCPSYLLEDLTFEEFEEGFKRHGKKKPVVVKGGVLLTETDFEIKVIKGAVKEYVETEHYA